MPYVPFIGIGIDMIKYGMGMVKMIRHIAHICTCTPAKSDEVNGACVLV